MEHIQIHMLGEFSLCAEGATISDAGNRSKKVWALLAFLICNRGRAIPQQKLVNLIWGDANSVRVLQRCDLDADG